MAKTEDGSEVRFWRNQYGQGIVVTGPLAEQLEEVAERLHVTPEDVLRMAIMETARLVVSEEKSGPKNS